MILATDWVIGDSAAGSLTVDGAGVACTDNVGRIKVGTTPAFGPGTFEILNEAHVTASTGTEIGNGTASFRNARLDTPLGLVVGFTDSPNPVASALTVDNSTVTVSSGGLRVGSPAAATMTVENGSTVTVGLQPNVVAGSSLLLRGGSALTSQTSFASVGGTLRVESGSSYVVNGLFLQSSAGPALVESVGPGSLVDVSVGGAHKQIVMRGDTSILRVEGGGRIEGTAIRIAERVGNIADVEVRGRPTPQTPSTLLMHGASFSTEEGLTYLGFSGAGTLLVEDGGVAKFLRPTGSTESNGLVIGATLPGGLATVRGLQSVLEAATIFVSSRPSATRSGKGDLVIEGDARVIAPEGIVVTAGGKLKADGTIEGDVEVLFEGIVEVGSSVGRLDIDGSYIEEGPDTNLLLEIAGPQLGAWDVLAVTGDVTLRGALEVSFMNGFVPSVGQVFPVIEAAGVIDALPSAIVDAGGVLPPGVHLEAVATATTIDITVVPEPGAALLALAALGMLAALARREAAATTT